MFSGHKSKKNLRFKFTVRTSNLQKRSMFKLSKTLVFWGCRSYLLFKQCCRKRCPLDFEFQNSCFVVENFAVTIMLMLVIAPVVKRKVFSSFSSKKRLEDYESLKVLVIYGKDGSGHWRKKKWSCKIK